MGREAKILLAILGLLAGVFVGVLSMKLLVPRPPAGAGPDIHDEIAAATPTDIVAPPELSPPTAPPDSAPETTDRYASASGFAAAAEATIHGVAPAGDATPTRDPFVARTAFAEPQPLADGAAREARPLVASQENGNAQERAAALPPPPVTAATYAPPTAPPLSRGAYVATAGDSWWSLAERTYGDGRLYRALFAWNRAINPRVSLVPGTPLELPSRSQLAAAWPALVPRE